MTAPINSSLNVVMRSPTPFGLGRNSCCFPRVPVAPGTSFIQTIFLPCCPLNDRRRAARSFFEIGPLFSLFYLSFARFFLLLMSGNVHPNPSPVFPCSVCAENVTRRRRSMQCCTCFKWVYLKCSLLSFDSKF